MVFSEDSRVKIPCILHLVRLGYRYLSLKNATWDEETNIFPELFRSAIALDAPKKQKINFEFTSQPDLQVEGGMAAYIGRSANIQKRIKGHFGLAKKTTLAQIQLGLYKSGVCKSRSAAVKFMLKHASLVYTILDGPEEVANRDIVEVALWGKYMTPFNIKSEH